MRKLDTQYNFLVCIIMNKFGLLAYKCILCSYNNYSSCRLVEIFTLTHTISLSSSVSSHSSLPLKYTFFSPLSLSFSLSLLCVL